jgi:hypothetical protein
MAFNYNERFLHATEGISFEKGGCFSSFASNRIDR